MNDMRIKLNTYLTKVSCNKNFICSNKKANKTTKGNSNNKWPNASLNPLNHEPLDPSIIAENVNGPGEKAPETLNVIVNIMR